MISLAIFVSQNIRLTHIQVGVLVKTCLQLLYGKTLGEHSLPDAAHVQLSSAFAGRSGTAVAHAADKIEDLRAWRLVAATIAVVVVQTGLADLDQSECLVDVVADDFVGKAETREGLGKTQDTKEGTWRSVRERLFAGLIPLLLLAQSYVRADEIVGDGLGDDRAECTCTCNPLSHFVRGEDKTTALRFRVGVVDVDMRDVASQLLVSIPGWSI